MNYPENIYRKFEIVEKEIYGEKHYGLVQVHSFLGITWRKLMPVVSDGFIHVWGVKWRTSKSLIEEVITYENRRDEDSFRYKVTK